MTTRYTIGIDVGTTGTKAILFDPHRGLVAQAARESSLYSPGPGHAEADPEQWLENVAALVCTLLADSGVDSGAVAAVAASGMVPAVLPIDDHGRPLRRAILQNDARAVAEIESLAVELADLDLVALTGSALTQQSVAPTAVWLARHEPEVWAQTRHLVGSYDWVLVALGAAPHVEQNWALESGLFTVDLEPLARVADLAGIADGLLPPVLRPGQIAGAVSAEAAERCGLRANTPLVVGGADHVLSAFAAGVQEEGDALVKLGGAGDILVATDTAVADPRLYLDAHPVPGRWLPNGCMATSGSLIRWYQSLVGGVGLPELDHEAADRPPAEVLCLPYFLGEKSPIHDPDLRGAFAGLHLGHTRADLYRAILEAIAFGFRHHLEVFSEIGVQIHRVMITNGGSRSRLWKQIHAEVLNTALHPVANHPGASLGAAIIAAVGVGELPDYTAVATQVTLDEPVVPVAEYVEIYHDAYSRWRDLGAALTPISHSQARRTRT